MITPDEAKRLALIRKRTSYHNWKELARKINESRSVKEILELVYKELDNHRAFGYQWRANASRESLDLVLQEMQ